MSKKGGGYVNNSGKKLNKQYTKRHPGLGWFFGIPDFKITNGFTYAIESLKDTEMSNARNDAINEKKRNLATEAGNALNSVAQSLKNTESNNATIRNALEFLKLAANSERQKEILVLKEYQDKIKSSLPEKEQKKVLKAIQSAEEIDLDKNFDFSAYSNLVLLINYLRNGYQQTLQRLQNLQAHNKKTDQTLKDYLTEKKTAKNKETDKLFQDIYKDSISFIGEQNILSLLGEASSSGRHSKSVFSQNFRNAIKKYIFSPEILAKFNNRVGSSGVATRGQLQGALLASIGTDILQVLQEQLDAQQKEDFVQLENIDQIVDEYFQNYRNSKNLTRFQRALLEDSTELQTILNRAVHTFGIEEIENDKELQRRVRQINYRDTKYDSENKNSFLNILNSTGNENLLKKFRGLKFNVTTKTSHGNFDEFLTQFVSQSIEDKTFQSRGGQAIDAYALLGSATCYLENVDDFIKYINAIDTAVIQARSNVRKTVENDQTDRLKNMNIAMQTAEKALIEKIKQIDALDSETKNIFIFHESFKLSKSAEVGLKGPFKGREMAILNYIDTLYTIPSDIFTPPDKENLYFLALNLADAASGNADVRESLRYYLSIFAGLIMFEDVERIALDIKAGLTTSVVKNIHLYKLNGIYVPSSMILSYTYRQMAAIYKIIEQDNVIRGFNASITINSKKANDAIEKVVSWTRTRNYPKDGKAYSYHWYELANDVASGTKVRIAFLSGFLKLIKKLTDGFID